MHADPSHAERALQAALFVCIVAQRFDEWLERRFPDTTLPDFAVGIGVHTGDVMVCRINTGAGVDTTIIGDTVNVASRLEEQTKKLGASVVTTLDTLAQAGSRFIPGKRGSLLVRGRASPVEITEITGLRPRQNVGRAIACTPTTSINEAVAHNTAIICASATRCWPSRTASASTGAVLAAAPGRRRRSRSRASSCCGGSGKAACRARSWPSTRRPDACACSRCSTSPRAASICCSASCRSTS